MLDATAGPGGSDLEATTSQDISFFWLTSSAPVTAGSSYANVCTWDDAVGLGSGSSVWTRPIVRLSSRDTSRRRKSNNSGCRDVLVCCESCWFQSVRGSHILLGPVNLSSLALFVVDCWCAFFGFAICICHHLHLFIHLLQLNSNYGKKSKMFFFEFSGIQKCCLYGPKALCKKNLTAVLCGHWGRKKIAESPYLKPELKCGIVKFTAWI